MSYKYYKVTKDNNIIGVIVAKIAGDTNYKIVGESSIFGLKLKLLFHNKEAISHEEFLELMNTLNLGIPPKNECPNSI